MRAGVVAVGLVALGGAFGTAARYLVAAAMPAVAGVPVAALAVNVAGAFLLGALLERLSGPGVDPDHAQRLRLLAGTGVLGGFTTYSALASETVQLLATRPAAALGYAVATVVVGGLASVAGIVWSRRGGRGRGRRGPDLQASG